MNVLVIDDDLFLRKALSFSLLEAGHSVTIATNGKEALDLIEKERNIDIIVCDVMMPVLTGPTFLLMLKKYFPSKMPAIIIISGVKDGEDFLKKLNINCDYFMSKPIDYFHFNLMIQEIAAKINEV